MDNLTSAQRAKCMAHIKRKDTKAEIVFRKAIWHTGTKGYRIDVNLPGRPDLFFPRYKLAIFIDGCFWHKCPKHYRPPKSNQKYWLPKMAKNVQRDREINKILKKEGWTVLRFWEHDINGNMDECVNKIKNVYFSKK